ncbi:MAG: branched-chain amino acid ABC transporter substrate-binding protein, partial [Rhodobacterales bacterium]|nr:branched-chain amino acid ABC transporter substrate-binding protein [Rhodobacterales bacterium]
MVDAPAQAVLTLADLPEAAGALILNATAPDSRLREEDCRANVLHTGLTPEMRADALMQVLAAKRWTDLALIAGPRPEDRVLAQAFAASARKFGLKLAATLDWPVEADLRRSASAEVPLFTQSLPDHDVLLVADEANDFARYVAYNTWAPRPLAGSEGMVPAGWARAVEAAGAAQLQGRFADLAGRGMQAPDYAAWAALRAYMLGPDFTLAGFKGRPLTFRPWNGQLRQPVPVAHAGALVAMAPV